MAESGPDSLLLALDLGTTSLAGWLVDSSGVVRAERSRANPQQAFGADILTRLEQARNGQALALQDLLLAGLRALVRDLCAQAGVAPTRILAAAAAGNPGISCLLRGLPVDGLLHPPHRPPDKHLAWLDPQQYPTGLSVPLQLFPLVSGFVGGDLVAVVHGVESAAGGGPGHSSPSGTVPETNQSGTQRVNESSPTLIIDVGTNGELALWDRTRWWVTSVAAGPAFEGGNIGTGMALAEGAVTDVQLQDDRFRLKVLGGGLAQGLCGSGLAALIAAALEGGLIDRGGRMVEPQDVESNLANTLAMRGSERAIRFYRDAQRDLVLTQSDLRNFQLAKGALYAGAEVLLERAGLSAAELGQVLLTGALGAALPLAVLKRVALLPEPMLDKIRFRANGVLQGLVVYLQAADGLERLNRLLPRLQPLPLSGTPAFENHFLAALEFC